MTRKGLAVPAEAGAFHFRSRHSYFTRLRDGLRVDGRNWIHWACIQRHRRLVCNLLRAFEGTALRPGRRLRIPGGPCAGNL